MSSTLQSIPIDPTPPALNDVLQYDGAKYAPAAVGGSSGVALTRVSLAAPIAGFSGSAVISFDTEEIDQNSAWAIGNPGQFTIPSNGNYRVQISVFGVITAGTDANFWTEQRLLGNTEVASNYLSNEGTVPYGWVTASITKNYSAGDVIELFFAKVSGTIDSAVTLQAGSFATLEKLS